MSSTQETEAFPSLDHLEFPVKARVVTEGFDVHGHFFQIGDQVELTGLVAPGLALARREDGKDQALDAHDFEVVG